MERQRHTLDASGKIAGRLATQIATLLMGKNKATWQPHIDGGDFVEVTNVSEMKFSGKKITQKKYYRYSGYPGGIKTKKLDDLMQKTPNKVLQGMVKDMLPKNRLRPSMLKRLTIK